jgi:Ni/Fe-hydrogenase 1 B-type cytochrome subunit
MQKKIYVWEAPVRGTHWINVICLVTLALTGVYIGNPFIVSTSPDQYLMGWVRFIHFVAAYIFIVSLAVRIYWSFAGNKYATWKALFPFTPERVIKLFRQMSFYALISKEPPGEIGHTALGGLVYFLILVLCGISAITGFAMFSLYNPRGTMYALFGWVFSLAAISTVRLIHHLIMWFLIYFVIVHIYVVLFLDSVERNGLLSSIFDGYKFKEEKKAG